MKTIITLLLVFSLIFTSCNKKENTTSKLNGKWHLIDVNCMCKPPNFLKGNHIWEFNVHKNKITVINKKNEDLQLLDNGVYEFNISDNTLTISSVNYQYYFKDNYLFIDYQSYSDGPLMKFIK